MTPERVQQVSVAFIVRYKNMYSSHTPIHLHFLKLFVQVEFFCQQIILYDKLTYSVMCLMTPLQFITWSLPIRLSNVDNEKTTALFLYKKASDRVWRLWEEI